MELNYMKQENKELLLRDLCARLPYGVRGERIWTAPVSGSPEKGIYVFDTFDINVLTTGYYDCGEYGFREVKNYSFKPYLFPLSSMTEEQKIKCFEGTDIELDENSEIWSKISSDTYTTITNMNNWLKVINWLLKNHFDIYGIVPKGLAIDCTNLNIY